MASLKQIGSLLERSFEKWDYQKAIKFSGNESETRDYLIEPFFEQLGYNKMEHYSHEFSLSFGKGKVKKVDMVISINGKKPIMLIECKKAGVKLNKNHYNQLDRVSYKDYKGHLKIIVDNMPSKEICNLVLNEKTQKIQFNNDSYELVKVSAEEIAKHKKRIVEEAIIQLLD